MTEHTNGPVQVGGFCSCPSQCLIEIGLCKSNFKPYSRSCQLSASVFICEVSHMGFYLFWKAWRLTYQVSLAHITEGGWFSRRSHRHLKILALASSRWLLQNTLNLPCGVSLPYHQQIVGSRNAQDFSLSEKNSLSFFLCINDKLGPLKQLI